MSRRPSITVALIALNEEPRLKRLLPRLAWADQVVVVDGGSHDATVRVARSHGALVAERGFDDFSQQRNFAVGLATSDWVLSLDADECPTQALVDEMHVRLAGTNRAAFRVPIHSSILGRRFRFSGTQDDCPVRLFRRGAARWVGAVHERLVVTGSTGRLARPLMHETLGDVATILRKIERYTELEACARVARNEPPRSMERWLAGPREFLRRFIWKQGWCDGPQGWAFCALSGWSEWVLANRHRQLCRATTEPTPSMRAAPPRVPLTPEVIWQMLDRPRQAWRGN